MAITTERAQELVEQIASSDRAVQGQAYEALLTATTSTVPWAYEIWQTVVDGLKAQDNRMRSICAQILANLAAHSDPEERILDDLARLAAVMSDDRFVTARHATQVFWKVGLGGGEPCEAAVAALARRFRTCADEKNAALVRTDIIVALAQLDQARPNTGIELIARGLIDDEPDTTARGKQLAVWEKTHSATT